MRPVMTMKATHDMSGRRIGLEDACEGKFHAWGVDYEEFEAGPGNYTVAIVEHPDGTVGTYMPHLIRFLDSEECRAQALVESLGRPAIIG